MLVTQCHFLVQGNAGVEPDVLDRAGIGRARALVVTTEDADRKLAITLIAHTLKLDLRIVVNAQNDPRGRFSSAPAHGK